MLEVAAVDHFLGGRECGHELHCREGGGYAAGGWLMKAGGDLVEYFGRGMSEKGKTKLVSWEQMNPISS